MVVIQKVSRLNFGPHNLTLRHNNSPSSSYVSTLISQLLLSPSFSRIVGQSYRSICYLYRTEELIKSLNSDL